MDRLEPSGKHDTIYISYLQLGIYIFKLCILMFYVIYMYPIYNSEIDNSHYRLIVYLGKKMGRKWYSNFRTQYKSIQNLQTLQGYIFRILQHFETKLCNFTHFSMFFLAVVIYLHLLQLA
jgi:hypothetical protein